MPDSKTNLPVCGPDGCEIPAVIAQDAPFDEANRPLELQVVSDPICPWCYVGKRHLEDALGTLKVEQRQLSVLWRPYELNPNMPKQGIDRREYRIRKFGSWERSQSLDEQVAAAGKAVGIDFRHDLMKRTPNTFDAHRLIWLAGREQVQDAVVEQLFFAYFTAGRDIGDHDVLSDVGSQAGMERDIVNSFLQSSDGTPEVATEIEMVHHVGLQGVPTFLLNGYVVFSGAQPPNVIAATIREVIHASSSQLRDRQPH